MYRKVVFQTVFQFHPFLLRLTYQAVFRPLHVTECGEELSEDVFGFPLAIFTKVSDMIRNADQLGYPALERSLKDAGKEKIEGYRDREARFRSQDK